MTDCLFCKIVAGDIPSTKVYDDDYVYAFKDIDPQAPVHVVIVPKAHYGSILEVPAGDDIIAKIHVAANSIAADLGLTEDGFRLVTNIGEAGGQTVPHLHYHLLGGRSMQWPPG